MDQFYYPRRSCQSGGGTPTPHHCAAAPNLIADSKALARSGNIAAAIQGFKTAQQWDSSLRFDPVQRARELAEGAKLPQPL